MYNGRAYSEIMNELKSRYGERTAKTEGGFAWDCLSSNALEFEQTEKELAEIVRNSFANSADAEYLELRCGEMGIYRKAGKSAVGKLTVYGEGTIRAGNIFSTEDNVHFLATEETAVKGKAEIPITAEEIGSIGNVEAGTIKRIPFSIPGIGSCINEAATFDGYDVETDEELRDRYLDHVRHYVNSGSPANYIDTVMNVVGVGTCRVWRCWNGSGTVKVIVADGNLEAANVELLKRVYEAVENTRPVGAIVSVVSAEILPVEITADIYGNFDEETFFELVAKYFVKLTKETALDYNQMTNYSENGNAGEISAAMINALMINSGAADVQNLQINKQSGNIKMNIEQVPKLLKLN